MINREKSSGESPEKKEIQGPRRGESEIPGSPDPVLLLDEKTA
jgi:hypothetical protein